MKTIYVVYKINKWGMCPIAYSIRKETADTFASQMGNSEVKSSDAEKVEHLLKQLKIKNLD